MPRVLFIDMFCPNGHISLNKNFILEFKQLGYEIEFVVGKEYVTKLELNQNEIIWTPQIFFYREDLGKIRTRLRLILMLVLIRWKITRIDKYDFIFFSSYDEISLFLSCFKGNFILVNHANIAGLSNPIKRFCFKKIASFSKFIVFHDLIRQECIKHGIDNVNVQSLGISDKYKIDLAQSKEVLNKLFYPEINLEEFNQIIFAPTGSKYGDNFIKNLISDSRFNDFLVKRNILLVIKETSFEKLENTNNIYIINNYISNEEYQHLFLNADLILLSYPFSFNLRISAILFECFSNQKQCILTSIPLFKAFENHFTYNPYYENTGSLIETIDKIISKKENINPMPYRNLELLKINFSSLFKNSLLPI